uniref:Uncharacterized protein n=1 Tax=Ditylenchus dipsaci TaxID=166011 RepID=A0A915DPJ7_9BILA
MGLSESRAQQPHPHSITYSSSTFGSNSLLPADLWSNRGQQTAQQSGSGAQFSPFLLTSAAEIVARERLVEQLEQELLLVSQDLNSNLFTPAYQEPTLVNLSAEILSSATDNSPVNPLLQLDLSEGDQQPVTEPNTNHSTTSSRITYFSSLRDLLADLLLHNELRLVENLASFTASNLNSSIMVSESSGSDSSSSSGSSDEAGSTPAIKPKTTDKRRVTRSTPIKTFTVSENKELKQSFINLVQDIRVRCGLCNKMVIHSPAITTSDADSSPLDRRKRCLEEQGDFELPHKTLPNHAHLQQELCGRLDQGSEVGLSNQYLPNKRSVIDVVKAKTFCVGYTDDGLGLMTASQDHKIRLYSSQGCRKRYMLRKLLDVPYVGWSILDVIVSPDGRDVIYSTWNEAMFQCNIHDPENTWLPLSMNATDARFALFSIRFNADGQKEVGKCVLGLKAHDDDVNAVCFGDQASHIILSGGDDGLCKVWDRRIMEDVKNPKPVGIFAGHRDGIVFIDSRGDDRYLLTNCKDQTVKVWDLRHFGSDSAVHSTINAVTDQKWDYRWQCSPMHNFVGNCVVYDFLTAETFKVYTGHAAVVRDVAWHPHQNEIVTSAWDGKTHVWRFDERAKRSINPDSSVTGDEDSCDENYEPIRKRFVDYRRRTGSNRRAIRSQDLGSQGSAIATTKRKKQEISAQTMKNEKIHKIYQKVCLTKFHYLKNKFHEYFGEC